MGGVNSKIVKEFFVKKISVFLVIPVILLALVFMSCDTGNSSTPGIDYITIPNISGSPDPLEEFPFLAVSPVPGDSATFESKDTAG